MDTNKIAIPISIVIAGAIIAGAVYMSSSKTEKKNPAPVAVEQNTNKLKPVTEDDHLLGSPNATLVIVEFSDPECPFCKTFHNTMHKIIDTYGKDGKVAWAYRHFPIDQLHPKARKEAEAFECANELGGNTAFWKYADELYRKTPSNNGLDSKELPIIAKSIGLDVKAFNDCLSSGKYADKIEAQYKDAIASGGRGTPHSIIIITKTGQQVPIEGAQPLESLKSTLETLLKN